MVGFWRSVRLCACVTVILATVLGSSSIATGAGASVFAPWSIVATPNTTSVDNQFRSVACVTSTDCWAVGSSDSGLGLVPQTTLAEHWNGTSWSIVTTPNPSSARNALAGVACTSTSNCWAVGWSGGVNNQILIEHWNGTVWSTSSFTGAGTLLGVTCVSASDCWATGAANGLPHWNGTTWSLVAIPPIVPPAYALVGITCVRAADCWTVGQTVTGNVGQNLALHWDGSVWSVETLPNTASDGLWEVSCVSSSDCWTVGGSSTASAQRTLAEHWDGSSWSIVATPNVASTRDGFLGVTCISTSDCWAVGSAAVGSSGGTLTEHWDGGQWTIAPSPNLDPSEANELFGVACTSTSDCWAVGEAVAAGISPAQTLAEHDTTAPTPLIAPGVASGNEGNSGTTNLDVPITLSNPSPQTVTVQWRTVFVPGAPANQADPSTDYVPASGTVTFAPGQISKTVAVSVKGDTIVEADEYVVLQFGNPTNATMGGFWGLGFGKILNDDGP